MSASRARSPFGFSLVNISLVLFFLSVFMFIAFAFRSAVNSAREQIEMKVILKGHVEPGQGRALTEKFKAFPFVREAAYESKEEALSNFMESTGEDFKAVMGEDAVNPMAASVQLKLKPAYNNSDSVVAISQSLLRNFDQTREVKYPINLIERLNENAALIQPAAAALGLSLLIVAFFLIMNTVRLAIFSRRLMIRSMQLVGAKAGFIRAPFLRMGTLQGTLGGLIAVGLLFGLLKGLGSFVGDAVYNFEINRLLGAVEMYVFYLALVVFGGIIGYFSSFVAVNRFLNKGLDEIA